MTVIVVTLNRCPMGDRFVIACGMSTESIIPATFIAGWMYKVQSETVRSISYVGAAQLCVLLATFLMIAVLTRLLTPEDFGVVSVGMVFTALLLAIQDFGVAPAVIQRDSRIQESISAGLALRWMIAVVLVGVVVLLSPLIADFYGNEVIGMVLIVMSANLLIQPFAFSSYVVLNRELRFSCLAIASMMQYTTMAVAAIGLALAEYSYWSIVLGSLLGTACYVVVLNYYCRTSNLPRIDLKLMRELMGFGSHLMITGLMGYVIFNVDQMIVGKALGIAVLGVYFVAVRFGRTLGEQIAGTANKVLFPTMARIKGSIEWLRIGYSQSLRMIAIVAVPLSMGVSALSPLFVQVVLGEAFADATLPIAILSFQGLLHALITPSANVLIAIGKPKYMSIQASVQAILIVAFVYPVANEFRLEGVCVLTTLLSLGVFLYFLLLFSRVFEVRFVEIMRLLAPAMLAGVVIFVTVTVAVMLAPATLFSLVMLAMMGAGLYVVSLHVFSRGRDLRDFLGLLKGLFSKSKASG